MKMQHIIEQCAQQGISITLEESGIGLTGDKHMLTPELLSLIKNNKEELTAYIQSFNNGATKADGSTIKAIDRGQTLPLSPTQENIWLANKVTGASADFNMPGACEVKGAFNFDAATFALNEIVRRHEILRTCYVNISGAPAQFIQQENRLAITRHDLTSVAPDIRADALIELLREDIKKPFDLELDLMLRASYIELERGENQRGVLLFNTHHIAFDGWSMEVLHSEFFELYHAFITGTPSRLPELSIQYADYASWQINLIESQVYQQQFAYWKKQLEDAPACHSLPLSYERSLEKQQEAAIVERKISAHTAKKLINLACAFKMTPFMLLHGALALVLARHSGSQDIVIGTPFANRQQPELASLIGFFVNTLVLRCNTNHQQLGEYLNHIKQIHVEAQSNQDVPFTKLVDTLKIARNPAYAPLFQVMLTTQNNFGVAQGEPTMALAGSTLSVLAPDAVSVSSAYDLDVNISLSEKGASVKFVYDIALFSYDNADELNLHLCQLLENLASHAETVPSDIPMSALTLLSEKETYKQFALLNGPKRAFDKSVCVQTVIEEQVAVCPDKIAVAFEGKRYTYQQLNEKANQLAHLLIEEFGVGPDTIVGVSMKRSCEQIVTVLAIMKAGGAYLPLDPDYPSDRLREMIADAGISLLVADERSSAALRLDSCCVLAFETCDFNNFPCTNIDPVSINLTSNNLAYVIYTSGSTGRPKGVMIEHRNLHHFLLNTRERYRIATSDNVLQFSTINFDIFVEEVFATLCSGATLTLRNEKCVSSLDDFCRFCKQNQITVVSLPTAFWHQLNAGRFKLNFNGLRLVILGGEALQPEAVTEYFEQVEDVELINSYGPTEATVTATSYHLYGEHVNKTVPIGEPNVNTSLFILDNQMGLVPTGSVGELYIGGNGLARGYLNQDALTSERFLPNPYFNSADELSSRRLYKTGDLVSCDGSGNLRFHGRLDDQVKIRGFRIELGEIENRLAQLPTVGMSMVMAPRGPGGKSLVAYVQSTHNVPDRYEYITSLKTELSSQLPDYMVPQTFVIVEQWPLTKNGKVDKKALAELRSDDVSSTFCAPQNDLQKSLLKIWSEALQIAPDKLSVTANFFEMGGNSLAAVKLVTTIKDQLHLDISVADIFKAQTICNLAGKLECSIPLNRAPITKAKREKQGMPLSFPQQRLHFIDKLQGSSAEYNMPAALEVTGTLDENATRMAFEAIVQRHEVLRTVFKESEEGVVQYIQEGVPFTLSRFDLSHYSKDLRDQKLQQLIENDAKTPFDLGQDIMLRASTILLAEGDANSPRQSILMFNMHHIASDGWSMDILVNEFLIHYHNVTTAQTRMLPALNIQYADFAVWQREWLKNDILEEQTRYWKQKLEGAPTLHSLPLDQVRPNKKQFDAGLITDSMPSDIGAALGCVAREFSMTPFMLLHSALALVLSRHSNSTDMVIGTPVANRLNPEVEHLIGFFANTLALRVNTDHESLADYLNQVRQVHLEAQKYQDLPFDFLIEQLRVPRDTAHSPLFQIMLTTGEKSTGREQAPLLDAIPGVQITPMASDNVVAKFDLSVHLDMDDNGVILRWIYDKSLFNATSISRLNTHLKNCLESLAAVSGFSENTPQLRDIAILSESEIQDLVTTAKGAFSTFPADMALHHYIEAYANETPDKTALLCCGQRLSFAQLNEKANKLAHYLIEENDVKPGQLIGLCTARSSDMAVGILSILKSGAAYVPLDPASPKSRRDYIVEDAKLELVLSQSKYVINRQFENVKAINFEAGQRQHLASHNPNVQLPQANSEQLAYVIYTSGSTGKPKGVCQSHKTLLSFCHEFEEQLSILNSSDESPWLWTSSYSFDASLKGLASLARGKAVVIATDDEAVNPAKLAKLMAENNVDVFNAVPQLLDLVVDELSSEPVNLISSGDTLSGKILNKLLNYTRTVGTKLLNAYGPTETGVNSSFALIEDQSVIGKATRNTELLILDSCERLVPQGAIGELHIGGEGLAIGYLHKSELTSEKFVSNPYYDDTCISSSPKLYKSGDLVRMLSDGNLQFIGRIDDQVKIRGYRIELGEIESVLSSHKTIVSAAVVLNQSSEDNAQLVAYVAVRNADTISLESLKSDLRQALPSYMVPDHFVVLGSLPVTTSGKLDRSALPALFERPINPTFMPARTAWEEKVAEIWAALLGGSATRLSITSDFFISGGHSLLVIKLLNEMKKRFDIDVTLAELFEASSIQKQALLAERKHNSCSKAHEVQSFEEQSLVTLQAGASNQRSVFLIHPVGGSVVCYGELVSRLSDDLPIYGIQTPQDSFESLTAMAGHYLALIQAKCPSGQIQVAGWSMGGVIAHEIQRLAYLQGDIGVEVVMIDSYPTTHDGELTDDLSLMYTMANEMGISLSQTQIEQARLNGSKAALQQLHAVAVRQSRLPADFGIETFYQRFNVIRQNHTLLNQHKMEQSPGHIVLIASDDQPSPHDWEAYCESLETTVISNSDHFSIVTSPYIEQLAEALARLLINSTPLQCAN